MHHSRIVLSVGDSVWYVVRNLHWIITIDSVLANSKTQNALLFPVHAMFRHDSHLAMKPASTPRRLVHKNTWRDSLPIDMLPFAVTIPATVPQTSEIPEGLMNYPVQWSPYVIHYRVGSCMKTSYSRRESKPGRPNFTNGVATALKLLAVFINHF
jgi:hypothetical protein